MGDMISQAEIDALLGGFSPSEEDDSASGALGMDSTDDIESFLTTEQRDILGEVGNINMGTSATTLSALLNQKVWITTPQVKISTLKKLADGYSKPCVGIRVGYKEGIKGSNILILRQSDVKIIANLMMGGDGSIDPDEPLTELDMSAISEAMNQMVGSASTSLSSLIKIKIDINTPHAFTIDFTGDSYIKDIDEMGIGLEEPLVSIQFRMEIGTLIDSEIMQILPREFAGHLAEMMKDGLMGGMSSSVMEEAPKTVPAPAPVPTMPPPQPQYIEPPQPQYSAPPQPQYSAPPQPPPMPTYMPPPQQPMYQQQDPNMMNAYAYMPQQFPPPPPQPMPNVNVQTVQFQNFDAASVMQQKENIGIIMDVPLEVTVELGRTNKRIKEILEFSPGTIIELDKLAGEPIDILVNGKFVAKGEVVVIDENFGIRITDIINVENRI